MAAKVTLVELQVKVGDKTKKQQFKFDHASRILAMPKNGGWELPKQSKYEMKEGKLVVKTKAAKQ